MPSASKNTRSRQSNSPLQFQSVGIKPESVVIDVVGTEQEIPNDFVWIFAGGTPPNAFLKKIGVGFGARDVTLETSKEAWKPTANASNSPAYQRRPRTDLSGRASEKDPSFRSG